MAQMFTCPKCGAPVQENAQFCLHCMTSFAPKQQIEKAKAPKSKKFRTTVAIIITAALLLSIAGVGAFVYLRVKELPICTPTDFAERAPLVTERLGTEKLWDVSSFTDVRSNGDNSYVEYSADISIAPDSFISIGFEDGGEVVSATIWDVPKENIPDAQKLLTCITDCFCNNYLKDIEDIIKGTGQYVYSQYDVPFEEYFTDPMGRTQQYNELIQNGGSVSTTAIKVGMSPQNKKIKDLNLIVFNTEKTDGDKVSYDLSVYIEKPV